MLKKTSRLEKLARREERATVKRIFYLSIVSAIIAIFFFTLGVSLLGKFADFLGKFFETNNEITSEKSLPEPPKINPLPEATNSAKLKVLGFVSQGEKVEIFLDSDKVAVVKLDNGLFYFEDLILKNGENKIRVRAVDANDQTGAFSEEKTIILDQEEPRLEVETPTEGQSFSGNNRIEVAGKTDADAQVFANGFLASLDTEGNFEVLIPVLEGENSIEIKAVDLAGNTKVENRKVNFKK